MMVVARTKKKTKAKNENGNGNGNEKEEDVEEAGEEGASEVEQNPTKKNKGEIEKKTNHHASQPRTWRIRSGSRSRSNGSAK